MGTLDILTLFREAGIPLVFIGFLIWLVKYFMNQLDTWRKEITQLQGEVLSLITNHLQQTNTAMAAQQHALEMLTQRIEIACHARTVFKDEDALSTE